VSVDLLITADVEIAPDHDLEGQRATLDALRLDLRRIELPITAFCTSDAAERFAPEVRRLQGEGHELACHGLSHAADEDFSRMSSSTVRAVLSAATRRLESVTAQSPRCFRGPFMASSTTTQRVLVENGYIADFSVCSQRVDIAGCRGGRRGWLLAPRQPYFPSERSPFRRGRVPIRVVPLSALGLPFLSGILYLGGLRFMRAFFQILLHEARCTGKPIVYLFHPYEFSEKRARLDRSEHAAPSKWIHRFYTRDRHRRYEDNLDLLLFMRSQNGVRPITATDYVRGLAHAER
jgi:hypothetical protein